MAIYSAALRIANNQGAQSHAQLVTTTTKRANVLEIGLTLIFANASQFGLGHMVGGSNALVFANGLPEIGGVSNGTSESTITVGHTALTGGTTPLAFYRRASIGGAVGAGLVWTFPRGLTVPTANSISVWNIPATNTNSNTDTWFVWDE